MIEIIYIAYSKTYLWLKYESLILQLCGHERAETIMLSQIWKLDILAWFHRLSVFHYPLKTKELKYQTDMQHQ